MLNADKLERDQVISLQNFVARAQTAGKSERNKVIAL